MISIYIVDDEPMAVQYLEYMLKNSGASYVIAGTSTNSTRALAEILDRKPDVVFTDISMPVMDGLKLAERVLSRLSCRVYLLTSYEDFQYARQSVKIGAADYILKNELTEELLRNLLEGAETELVQARRQQRLVLEGNLRNYLLGDTEALGEAKPIESPSARYALLNFYEPARFYMDHMRERPERMLDTEAISRLPWLEGLRCDAFVRMRKGEYGAVIHIDVNILDTGRRVYKVADLILARINAEDPGWRCIQSDICLRFDELRNAYQQASALKDYLYAYPEQSIFCLRDIAPRPEVRRETSEEYIERIHGLMVDGSHDRAIVLTEEFLAFSRQRLGMWEYTENMRSLFQVIRRLIARRTLNTESLLMADVYLNAENLERSVLNCEEMYFESLEKSSGAEYSEHVQRAIDYIRKNCGRDIAVADVASAIGISEGHLRRLFKQELNTSVIDYLTDCRIDRVKALMRDERLTLTEIWRQSGFSSAQYMSQVFRKREGMLPKAYMKQVREDRR